MANKKFYWPRFFYFQNVKLYFKFIENKCFEGLSSVDWGKVGYRRLETEGGVGVGVDATPDSARVTRLKTFYEAMAISERAGIEFGDDTEVIYRDAYAYLDHNKLAFCERNCDDVLYGYIGDGVIAGKYDASLNRITVYRTGVEPWYIGGERVVSGSNGEINVESWAKTLTNSGVESAVWTLGHEAAHSRGIDMLKGQGADFHRNAEIAGQRALDSYRYIIRRK